MIRRVWFAQDVIQDVKNPKALLATCQECVNQFMQLSCAKYGQVNVTAVRFQDDIARIIEQVFTEEHPHLRGLLGVTFHMLNERDADIQVRFSLCFKSLIASNPGSRVLN